VEMNDNTLARTFFQHDGKLSDKWEQYLSIYEIELKRFVAEAKPVRLLEIGVQNGGSLEIWSKYLPPGSTVIGVDIDPKVQNLRFEGNVQAFVADINDSEKVERLIGADPFDIVIDDGSHTSRDIIAAFKSLFSRVSPGGKYIVEDLHASYWSSHGGGLRLRSSSIEYLKDIVDALNADHFRSEDTVSTTERLELQKLGKQIARVTFYDSVAVIEKLIKEKEQPYRHLISGQHALVEDPLDFIVAAPTELIQSWLLGETAARSINLALKNKLAQSQREIASIGNARKLLEIEAIAARDRIDVQSAYAAEICAQREKNAALEEKLQGLHSEVQKVSARAEAQQAHNTALEAELNEAQNQLARARSDVNAILTSTSWRATAALRRFANLIRK
jgi:SAM-dependent methyltransferase